jgi:hypothetical protein
MHDVRHAANAPTNEQIRQRAYQIWREAGCPEGRHEEDWAQARSELQNPSGAHNPVPERLTPTEASEVR